MFRIRVDFNSISRDERERVYIGRQGSPYEDQRKLEGLHAGMPVLLYDSEMEVRAVLEFEHDDTAWLAVPDWTSRRELLTAEDIEVGEDELVPR